MSLPVRQPVFFHEVLREGLTLYAAREIDEADTGESVRSTQLGCGLRLPLVLEGCANVSFGGRRLALGLQNERKTGPSTAIVSIARPELFSRRLVPGNAQCVVNLTLAESWLNEGSQGDDELDRALEAFLSEHLAIRPWKPSRQALGKARELMAPPPMPVRMRRLFLESRCLDIVQEALGALAGEPRPAALPARVERQMRALCDWIDAAGDADWQLGDLAREAGMSISTLQRHFRIYTGRTVYDYVRTRRLAEAKRLLEHEGVSVTEAALAAGYGNPANFATAFRREFGMAPSRAARRG
ncbi:helix-turn-helix transcriptional regulator [Paludibacterium paludis]|uniref:AraC family transcriptional regulator n=1 Tax=Paludibacterium paludis TaxID=1225769 RepID=A0A918UBG3_9NEIS|nr:AraC family transcriptional regulator [Paludibacterium paludis]GGY22704.1 AraC family transcriptional regulator [Paludibacterium paludis]